MILKHLVKNKICFSINILFIIQPALVEICNTPICQQTASDILDAIDPSVNPCDDFYKFACGGLLKKSLHGKPMTVDALIEDEVEDQIKRMLREPINSSEAKAIRGLKMFFKSCMDETAIERDGSNSIKHVLKQLGGWPIVEGPKWNGNNFKFEELLVKLRRLGYEYNQLFSFLGGQVMMLSTPRGWYEDDKEKDEEYQNFIVNISTLLGADRQIASTEAQEIIEFKKKLFYVTDLDGNSNKMTYHDFQEQSDLVNWLNFVNDIRFPVGKLSENDTAYFPSAEYLTGLEQLLNETSPRTVANYIIWEAIERAIPYFPEAFRNVQKCFQDSNKSEKEEKTRFDVCRKLSQDILPPTFETLYATKYFSPQRKESVEKIMLLTKEEFVQLLKKTELYDDESRVKALAKGDAIRYVIGGPDEIFDQKQLQETFDENENLNTDDFLTIASILNQQKNNKELKYNSALNDSYTSYTSVNAYHDPLSNTMIIPGSFLQGVYYHEDRPEFINFGRVGMLVGHELTHGFSINANNEDNMWTNATTQNFRNRSECIIQQASSFDIEGTKLRMNGRQVLEETTCDFTGVEVAHRAYENWMKTHGTVKKLPGLNYTPKQLFWIASVSYFCDVVTSDKIENYIKDDPHGHPAFRIIGALSNNVHFGKDFNCPVGSRMNPSNKCQIF